MKPRKPTAKQRAALSPIKNIKWEDSFIITHGGMGVKFLRKPIRKVSTKRAAQNRQYTKQRVAFLERNPTCKVCFDMGWKERSTEVHHMKSRIGKMLLDERYWLPVCRTHHDQIHHRPAVALEKGYTLRR